LKQAIERSNALGILFVASAGNDGQDNDQLLRYPSSYNNANIISVTATDALDARPSWANYGATTVDLGAPGDGIWSTLPSGGRRPNSNGSYDVLSGTSMAAPHVTGTIALLRAFNPSLTHLEIRDRLLRTGDPAADLTGTTATGRRLKAYNALANIVLPPPPSFELAVVVGTGKASYRFGEPVAVTARVTAGGSVVAAQVQFMVRTANGKSYSATGVTDGNGEARWQIVPNSKDGRGPYQVTVLTCKAGYHSAQNSATFTVGL